MHTCGRKLEFTRLNVDPPGVWIFGGTLVRPVLDDDFVACGDVLGL